MLPKSHLASLRQPPEQQPPLVAGRAFFQNKNELLKPKMSGLS
jgi:hypothetical protein